MFFKKKWIYRHKRLSHVRVPRDSMLGIGDCLPPGCLIGLSEGTTPSSQGVRDAVPVRSRYDSAGMAQFCSILVKVMLAESGGLQKLHCIIWPR